MFCYILLLNYSKAKIAAYRYLDEVMLPVGSLEQVLLSILWMVKLAFLRVRLFFS